MCLSVIQRQVDSGQAFRVWRSFAVKIQVVEHASGNPGKIDNAKIHHADLLPDQIDRHLVLGGHAHGLGKLSQ